MCLDIGAQYHMELMEKLATEKEEAVNEAIERAEKLAADTLKAEVERLHEYAAADRERALKQQQAMHDQLITVKPIFSTLKMSTSSLECSFGCRKRK